MHNNKGFTLVEVIVCSIVITLLTISLVTAFAAIRQVNKGSADTDTAVGIADSVIEQLRNIKYDDITDAKLSSKITLPSDYTGYSYSSVTKAENSKSFEINGISYDAGYFNTSVTISPRDNDINGFKFVSIGDIASSTTCIVDTRSFNTLYRADFKKNDDGSYIDNDALCYDNLMINELMVQNSQYIEGKYNDLAEKTDGIDMPAWGTGEYKLATADDIYPSLYKTMDITFTKDGDMYTVNAFVNYKISRADLFGKPVITKQFKQIDNKKYKNLTDLYIIYEKTKCVSDIINIYNGAKNINGESINNAVKLNLFFIIPNKYNSDYTILNKSLGNYTAIIPSNLKINPLKQVNPDPKLITCYTNVKNLNLGSAVANIIPNERINKEESRVHYYDVNIDVTDSSGASVYSETKTTTLK